MTVLRLLTNLVFLRSTLTLEGWSYIAVTKVFSSCSISRSAWCWPRPGDVSQTGFDEDSTLVLAVTEGGGRSLSVVQASGQIEQPWP